MQSYTIYLFLWNTLYVSGGSSAHHKEFKNCIYSIGYFVKPFLLPATVVEEMELSASAQCYLPWEWQVALTLALSSSPEFHLFHDSGR